jgi:hypothetical protein
MPATAYKRKPAWSKPGDQGKRPRDNVAIPNARALRETAKALCCDFGDDADHWVPKSQTAAQSEVKRLGDRGLLVVSKWWAETAGVMKYASAQQGWNQLPHFRHRLEELHAALKPEDPSRGIIKTLCDALHEDLGPGNSPISESKQ